MNYTQTTRRIISDDGFLVREEVFVKIGLRRCPFCRGKAEVQHCSTEENGDMVFIECKKCGNRSNEFLTHEEAAQAWNRRVPSCK